MGNHSVIHPLPTTRGSVQQEVLAWSWSIIYPSRAGQWPLLALLLTREFQVNNSLAELSIESEPKPFVLLPVHLTAL